MSQANAVLVERYINASPATVFSFFTSSERWLLWQGVEATIEPEPGGVFRVNVSGDGFASGRILEVVPDRRLVFTWGWESGPLPVPPGSSRVEIELLPDGPGTRLRLTHTGLPPEFVDLHQQGWGLYAGKLQSVAESASG
jgi:uncharacterized protein YndB with AHSA1/START domain